MRTTEQYLNRLFADALEIGLLGLGTIFPNGSCYDLERVRGAMLEGAEACTVYKNRGSEQDTSWEQICVCWVRV